MQASHRSLLFLDAALLLAMLPAGDALSKGEHMLEAEQDNRPFARMLTLRVEKASSRSPRGANASKPTEWDHFLKAPACTSALWNDKMEGGLHQCGHAAITYSPSMKFAYLKTAPVAASAFEKMMRDTFEDAVSTSWHHLPEGTFLFTFVQDPAEHKLTGFAEVDAIRRRYVRMSGENTTFQRVPVSNHAGEDRYMAFLDDLVEGRFNSTQKDQWQATHASSQMRPFCDKLGVNGIGWRLDFIGHIENLEADWRKIQILALIPHHLRTYLSVDTYDVDRDYRRDFHLSRTIQRSSAVMRRMCTVFKSDFACLGYTIPSECAHIVK